MGIVADRAGAVRRRRWLAVAATVVVGMSLASPLAAPVESGGARLVAPVVWERSVAPHIAPSGLSQRATPKFGNCPGGSGPCP